MTRETLTAISPLDGRYRGRLDALADVVSELALMRYRVRVELAWFAHLADTAEIKELPALGTPSAAHLRAIDASFGTREGERIKELERTTNHDVKAVEYFVKEAIARDIALSPHVEFVHFACTSEDINNLSYGLMLSDARTRLLVPAMTRLIDAIAQQAVRYADVAMVARTHGQAATPTTMGKELANVVERLRAQQRRFQDVRLLGKMNGAVGNYNAHVVAYPNVDWVRVARSFVEGLGLEHNAYTTQIEPHDCIAEYCHALTRFNQVLLDFDRDVWGYVAIDYFRSRKVEGETGSSTMPHKVNPIDFENSEGNVGLANAMLGHLAEKLPVSRWQRDLSDSTALRNLGVGIGHTIVAIDAALKGVGKLELNDTVIARDLDGSYEVLSEAVQTVMRKHGIAEPYEQLKRLTRGRRLDAALYAELLANLELPTAERAALAQLTPATYVGLAPSLARRLGDERHRMNVQVTVVPWRTFQAELRELRQRVFTVEQGVPAELDLDGEDDRCVHFVARYDDGRAIGTARLMPTGQIGRMAVLAEHRKHGIGRRLLELAVAEARRLKLPRVFLHAQSHAKGFYERSGFVAHSAEFEEAGISHVEMTLRADD